MTTAAKQTKLMSCLYRGNSVSHKQTPQSIDNSEQMASRQENSHELSGPLLMSGWKRRLVRPWRGSSAWPVFFWLQGETGCLINNLRHLRRWGLTTALVINMSNEWVFRWLSGWGRHATCSANPSLSPRQRTYAACHIPSLSHCFVSTVSTVKWRCLCLKLIYEKKQKQNVSNKQDESTTWLC